MQAAAIFAWVEGPGFGGFAALENVKPAGPEAEKEKKDGLEYLRDETTAMSPNGSEVSNDPDFVSRFGDLLQSPAIAWLEKYGLLEDDAVRHPKKLTAVDKTELLKLLIDAKGFGLEAVKGALFLSISPSDVDQLVALRAAIWYSPNPYSNSRTKTIGILLRHAGKWSVNDAGGAKEAAPPESPDAVDGPPPPNPADLEAAGPGHDLTNSIGMKLAKIPAGEFQMGNDESVESLVRTFPYAKRAWFQNAARDTTYG